jgi:AcrR family transcriptional regulator
LPAAAPRELTIPLSDREIQRRASYGPASPLIGARGTRTRARIVASTLALFESRGFDGTSVDHIAKAAGVSRATLYQYFENKDQIFVELLDECGTALMRVIRRIGPLGPTALGFDNLRWWLGEWAWVYDRYATMFVQWASIDSPETTIRALVEGFRDSYDRGIIARLASSGVEGIDPADAAVMMTTIVNRFNYYRHIGMTHGRTDELIDNLAVAIQLVLFPFTPPDAFRQIEVEPRPAPGAAPANIPVNIPANIRVNEGVTAVPRDRPGDLSARAAATVRHLLDAGAKSFADRGYARSSVDDIVAEAGFARGTFYKYFDEKLDLLGALSDESGRLAVDLGHRFQRIDFGSGTSPDQLRAWLADYTVFAERYCGVTRAWLQDAPDDPRIARMQRLVRQAARTWLPAVLGRIERQYPLDPGVAGLVLFAALERVPETLRRFGGAAAAHEHVVNLTAEVIERGLLNGRPVHRAGR